MEVTDKITITQEDNMALMARYPDNYFDLAICDPPYGLGIDGQKGDIKKGVQIRKAHSFKGWDNAIPTAEYFAELKRVSKNQIVWGANYFTEFLPPTKAWIFWYKGQQDLTMSDGEMAWTSLDKVTRMVNIHRTHIWQEKPMHPTQKPVVLYKWLLDKYAKIKCNHKHSEAERYLCTDCNNGKVKILDTHLGSGSIAIACHDYGFELTACELDQEYYDKAIQRITNHVSQQKLF
jgi:site-specific DNA-methyltransferase (adenine-specific)